MIKQIKFFIFGDSICFGQLISPHKTWVFCLAKELDRISQDLDIILQNPSVNGNTTRQALERMSYDITSYHPDILLIQFGLNDCNYWETDFGMPRVTPKAFQANLTEIGQRAIACGSKLIFLGTNHPSLKGSSPHYKEFSHSERNLHYNEIIREVAVAINSEEVPVVLIDHEKNWKQHIKRKPDVSSQDFLLPDGIHLNELGHKLYEQKVLSIVMPPVWSLLR